MAAPAMEQGGVGGPAQQREEDDLLPCHICGRTFFPRPLRTHVRICEKNATKKRKVFNSLKQRIQGTDLAEFHHKSLSLKAAPAIAEQPSPPRSRWKEKHEQLVQAIKAAKVEAPADSPVNKPSGGSMRRSTAAVGTMGVTERCPSCDRQFGPKAFDRHVEWCKERANHVQRSPAPAQDRLAAKERLEARTKYRVPPLAKSRRSITRDKYSGAPLGSRTESMVSVRSCASVPSVRPLHSKPAPVTALPTAAAADYTSSSPGARAADLTSAAGGEWSSTPLHVSVCFGSGRQRSFLSSAEELVSVCTVASDCRLFLTWLHLPRLGASAPLAECELEIEVYSTHLVVPGLEDVRGSRCLPCLSQILTNNQIRSVNVALPHALETFSPENSPKPRVFVKRKKRSRLVEEGARIWMEAADRQWAQPSGQRALDCPLPQLQLQPLINNGGKKHEENDPHTCLPKMKCSSECLKKKPDIRDTHIAKLSCNTSPKLKRGSTFVKVSPVSRDKESDSETVRSASDSKLRPSHSHLDPIYDPFITAEKQLLELLKCEDVKTSGARVSLCGILGKPASAPPASDGCQDDFELLENYINANFDKNAGVSERKYSDDFTNIDPKLINANDDLDIPDNLLADDYSPMERAYSGKKISVVEPLGFPKRALKHRNTDTIDDIDFDEFMSSFNEDEFILPIRSEPKRKATASVDSCSSGVSAASGGKKQLAPIKRSLSVSSPAVKARSIKSKQDIQEYLHCRERDPPHDLFPSDHHMYEEYKRYEEQYLRERSCKPSGDSAYGSLNRIGNDKSRRRVSRSGSKVEERSPQARAKPVRSPSSSGSDTAAAPAPSQTAVTKFCHECGSRFPLATAKFCVECGVKRLVL